jgi:NAD(P)-dependent dehydrogenase (short-subunit alcohol dehydrogenase family)
VGAGGEVEGFATDARKEDDVARLVEAIEAQIGAIDVFVFNIGANVPCGIRDETARKFFKIWEMACFAGFLTGQAVARRMAARRRGKILFTGATAALRGAANFGAFTTAKHGLRALAQSMARELGPMNVHVAHVVIDGAIYTAFVRDNCQAKYDEKSLDGVLSPDHIADACWYLDSQPRDAWTFELDLRPWMERW